ARRDRAARRDDGRPVRALRRRADRRRRGRRPASRRGPAATEATAGQAAPTMTVVTPSPEPVAVAGRDLVVVGIDPGLEGGVAAISVRSGVVVGAQLFRTPTVVVRRRNRSRREYDVRAMWTLLMELVDYDGPPVGVVEIALEAAGARPRQGVTSTFRNGLGAG